MTWKKDHAVLNQSLVEVVDGQSWMLPDLQSTTESSVAEFGGRGLEKTVARSRICLITTGKLGYAVRTGDINLDRFLVTHIEEEYERGSSSVDVFLEKVRIYQKE